MALLATLGVAFAPNPSPADAPVGSPLSISKHPASRSSPASPPKPVRRVVDPLTKQPLPKKYTALEEMFGERAIRTAPPPHPVLPIV
jgi:hypothetical protein